MRGPRDRLCNCCGSGLVILIIACSLQGWLLKGRSLQHLRAFPEAAEAFTTACQCPQKGKIAPRAAVLPPAEAAQAAQALRCEQFHKLLVKKLERVQAQRRETAAMETFLTSVF